MNRNPVVLMIAAIALMVLASATFSVVPETRQGVIVRFGEPISIVNRYKADQDFGRSGAGLIARVPFVDQIVWVDKRVLDVEMDRQQVLSTDQLRLNVDAYARYRIVDPLLFYQTVGTVQGAEARLQPVLISAVRRVLGGVRLSDVVRDKREQLMADIKKQSNAEAKSFGIDMVDVRLRRADLPQQTSDSVFKSMRAQFEQQATDIRSRGKQRAQEIQADADRRATVIRAEAQQTADVTRGEGDAQRSAVFAEAYNQDRNFFAFYRSMQAYEKGLNKDDTRLVISPDSAFFRFMNDPSGTAPAPAKTQ